jgi:probable F420-dependent oxidoreductase
MQIDAGAQVTSSLLEVEASAIAAEEAGYDGFGVPETRHDPFTVLPLAARATSTISLHSAIAVAFARNPMNVAVQANDIQLMSGGRFRLGLGSQVRGHIERRYSMPWSHPAARMEEFIAAIKAIWQCWSSGEKLAFRGEFYHHTLMTPFFDPGPNPYGTPKVFLAAVGQLMTEVAGEVADGLLAHGFTTARYMREVTLPALDRGLARSGRTRDGYEISYPAMMVTGATEEEITVATQAVKQQLAFYASTPAYKPVLDLHGWGDLFSELNPLSKRGEWVAMADLIPDDMLDAFAVTGEIGDIPAQVVERYGDMVTRVSFYAPYRMDRAAIQELLAGFRAS